MPSNRHNRMDDDSVLDAARDCVLAVGVRRTTLTDVARRAGVSRMTLYRRWPDVRTLVGDLMTREWIAVAQQATDAARTAEPVPHDLAAIPDRAAGAASGARARMVQALVGGVQAFREHPLFRKIVEVDPDMLLPYMLDRRGASQEALLEFIESGLREGHADGSIRIAPVARQSRALLLTVQSFALSLQTMTEPGQLAAESRPPTEPPPRTGSLPPLTEPGAGDPEQDLAPAAFYAELRHLLERSLAP